MLTRLQIVVERSSAILEYENEISSHIDADHHTICKFESREDPGYTTLKNLLAHVIQSTTERSDKIRCHKKRCADTYNTSTQASSTHYQRQCKRGRHIRLQWLQVS